MSRPGSGIAIVLLGLHYGCSHPPNTTNDASHLDVVDRTDVGNVLVRHPTHSSAMAFSDDGERLWVSNPDSDSIAELNTVTRQLIREVQLSNRPPFVDPTTRRYRVSIAPRSVALSSRLQRLYVTGQFSGEVIVVSTLDGTIISRIAVGSEPQGVVVSPDESQVYVACASDAEIVQIDATSLSVQSRVATLPKPWALAWSSDYRSLYVSHLLGPGISVVQLDPLTNVRTVTVPDVPRRGSDDRLAYGVVRGLYDLGIRPGQRTREELWTAHMLFATETAQPALKFDTTVFSALTVIDPVAGILQPILHQLWPDAHDVPGVDGAIADIVSGPHNIEFSPDGRYVYVLDTNSEDILVVNAETKVAPTVYRPLPGNFPEGMVISPDGRRLYIYERNTNDVAVVAVDSEHLVLGVPSLVVDGAVIPTVVTDPMPMNLRVGQRVFFSANSDEIPVTNNHWVACANCHIEGRSSAVTLRFAQGPRDTPTNAGGMIGTGFLFHTATRRFVRDYGKTIEIEQGGRPNDPSLAPLLPALEEFVNLAIPLPIPPRTDPVLVQRGREIFERPDVGCANCHRGEMFTDSGNNNNGLDLAGPIQLHNVGSCNTASSYPDRSHVDDQDHPRSACEFDTPSLRGVADSWPYLHDGSARTLRDALERTRGQMGNINGLSEQEITELIEYLRSL